MPSIVAFGEYVDTHKWAYYLFNGATSFIALYLYVCAVCRIKTLKLLDCGIIMVGIIISYIVEAFLPTQLFTYNIALYFILVAIIGKINKIKSYEVFYSSCICFVITAFSQSISLEIRGLSTLVSYPNTATYFILLIDLYIWSVLLYLFFNYKGEEKMGRAGAPWYGEDLANAIEAAKTIIAKIENNKYDEQDIKEFTEVNAEIAKYATKNKD